jgi:serine/threonine protein kinase/tetratricopeptide (TPR) repeat protein
VTPEEWRLAKRVLEEALERPAEGRSDFIEAICGENLALRDEVRSLLAAAETGPDAIVDQPPDLSGLDDESSDNDARGRRRPALSTGDRLGPYVVVGSLGAGGMGEVYRARDTRLRRDVAVKVLPEDLASDPKRLRRFEREARAASVLSDPHIVAVFDVGREGSLPYFVAEFVDGQTLSEMLVQGAMPLALALDLAEQIAIGLAAAHALGVIHRDLKPDNVLVTKSGVAKIADFGLAKLTYAEGESSLTMASLENTASGIVLGTAGYMAPEQVQASRTDARCDVFSFGCLLYEMVTGRKAFPGTSGVERLAAILRDTPMLASSVNPAIPSGLDRIIARCLEKSPDQRFQNARDLALSLRTVPRDAPAVAARRPASKSRLKRPQTVAILPFGNATGDPSLDYLADGVTEGLIGFLSGVPKLQVMARGTVFRFRGAADPRAVGRDLNVDAVLTGVMQKRDATLDIQVELVDTERGFRIWGDRYSRPVLDVLAFQEDIAREIWTRLRGTIPADLKLRLARRYQRNEEAHSFYLQGLHESHKGAVTGFVNAIALFEKAIAKDPGYALAYAAMADCYVDLGMARFGAMPPREAYASGEGLARQALEIDDSLAEAHTALGNTLYWKWDFSGAEEEFRAAIRLNPSAPRAHHLLGLGLIFLSRFEESAAELRRALTLDPLSPMVNSDLGWNFNCSLRHDAAIHQLKTTLEIEPGFPPAVSWLAAATLASGDASGAITILEREIRRTGRLPLLLGILARACGKAGLADQVRNILLELEQRKQAGEYISSVSFVSTHLALGQFDEAFTVLEKAYEEGASILVALNVYEMFDPIREDPRFRDLVRRVGLPSKVGEG